MTTLTSPWNLPLFGAGDSVAPLEGNFNLISNALNTSLSSAFAAPADLDGLAAVTGMVAGSVALVLDSGATFRYNGVHWVQATPATAFISLALLSTAYAKGAGAYLVAGATCRIPSESFERRYTGTNWRPYGSFGYEITPTVSGGGVTVSDGRVLATAASSCSMDFVSADFDAYKVRGTITSRSTQGQVEIRVRAAGADLTAASYNAERIVGGASAIGASNVVVNGNILNGLATQNGDRQLFELDIINPGLAFPTEVNGWVKDVLNSSPPGIGMVQYSGEYTPTTIATGISVLSSAGTFTGHFEVEGYRIGLA